MYEYKSVADIVALSEKYNITFADVVLRAEMELTQASEENVIAAIKSRLVIFENSVVAGLKDTNKTPSGMSGWQGALLNETKPVFFNELQHKAYAYAIAVNESNMKMKRIVACPTAGSCGIVPGCFIALKDVMKVTEDQLVQGLLAASGIGNVVTMNAFVAGAMGGCQAECGTASSMAAAGMVQMWGGSAQQCSDAAALAMKNILGLTCDPIAGLVEVPCIKRNGFHAVHAMVAAEFALDGLQSAVPMDEVIAVMKEIGENMPACYRETSVGGLAVSPTGESIRKLLGMI